MSITPSVETLHTFKGMMVIFFHLVLEHIGLKQWTYSINVSCVSKTEIITAIFI